MKTVDEMYKELCDAVDHNDESTRYHLVEQMTDIISDAAKKFCRDVLNKHFAAVQSISLTTKDFELYYTNEDLFNNVHIYIDNATWEDFTSGNVKIQYRSPMGITLTRVDIGDLVLESV